MAAVLLPGLESGSTPGGVRTATVSKLGPLLRGVKRAEPMGLMRGSFVSTLASYRQAVADGTIPAATGLRGLWR